MSRTLSIDEDFPWDMKQPEGLKGYGGKRVAIWNKGVTGHGVLLRNPIDG